MGAEDPVREVQVAQFPVDGHHQRQKTAAGWSSGADDVVGGGAVLRPRLVRPLRQRSVVVKV